MNDIASSILGKLKNKSKETGKSYQLCLQLYCQEEFLRRLQKSKYSDNLILKGGLFIYVITGFESRATIDIDFLVRQLPNKPEELKNIVQEIIDNNDENDVVVFEITKANPITVTKKYAGVNVSMIARIKNTRTPINIDFGVGDVVFPKFEKRSIPTQLAGDISPLINTYSVETTISEKLDAILYLMDFTSRMKDYYDIFYLLNRFDFDGSVLKKAIESTFNNRKHLFSMQQYEQMIEFSRNDDMNKKWRAFLKKMKIEEIEFTYVLNKIDIFIRDVFVAMLKNEEFNLKWNSSNNKWN